MMSERTENNKKGELTMALVVVIVVAMLALPLALSVFRDSVSFVALLLKATPFVLITCAIGGMVYVSKTDK